MGAIDKRRILKINTGAGFTPTLGPGASVPGSHTGASWTSENIYQAEIIVDLFTDIMYFGGNSSVYKLLSLDSNNNLIIDTSSSSTGNRNINGGLNSTSNGDDSLVIGINNTVSSDYCSVNGNGNLVNSTCDSNLVSSDSGILSTNSNRNLIAGDSPILIDTDNSTVCGENISTNNVNNSLNCGQSMTLQSINNCINYGILTVGTSNEYSLLGGISNKQLNDSAGILTGKDCIMNGNFYSINIGETNIMSGSTNSAILRSEEYSVRTR